MVDFIAFRGWRPTKEKAAEVAAVPYDVVDTIEGRREAEGRPDSLLHVTRPDIDLPDGTSLYDDAVYAGARKAFDRLLDGGVIRQDAERGFYVYAQSIGDHRQLGLMGLASAEDYRAGRIKRHEFTRPAKEDDRKRHIETVRAHLGPVFLACRSVPAITKRIEAVASGPAEVDFTAPDGVRHTLWPVFAPAFIADLEAAFAAVPALYIADGHHRAAAAARVGEGAPPGDARGRFLAVVFPDDALRILPYNRVVADLNGHAPESILVGLAPWFEVTKMTSGATPDQRGVVTMYMRGQWYRLAMRPDARPADPVGGLDVSVLQTRVLAPLFGIGDPRTDERIDFVGGIRGLDALVARAKASDGAAFALYPTSMADLMAIADAGEVMPPKSTWFEPKLRSGMVISRY